MVSSFSRLMFVFALLFFCLVPLAAQAQIKIAVVDVEKILNDSAAGKSIEGQLKSRREAFQKEFSARENNLMNAEKILVENQKTLSAEEFSTKRQEFEKQLLETRNLFQKRRQSLDKGLGNALAELRKNILSVTAEIADEKNYQVVLSRDSVVIVEKEMDITGEVLKRMDSKIKTIPLNITQ